jgi:hypothetical protein
MKHTIKQKQMNDLLNKVKSINLPEDRNRVLWITLKSPLPIGWGNRAILEKRFKLLCDLFTRKTARIPGFENVGGLFVREYGEKATGLHFHCLLFDLRPNPTYKPRIIRTTTGEPIPGKISDLEEILHDKWLEYMRLLPLTPEVCEQTDWGQLFFSEKVTLDAEGVPDKLKDYIAKTEQKSVQIPENAPKHRWFGWINQRALSFRSHGGQITPRAA